jgi:hypothetical protein
MKARVGRIDRVERRLAKTSVVDTRDRLCRRDHCTSQAFGKAFTFDSCRVVGVQFELAEQVEVPIGTVNS